MQVRKQQLELDMDSQFKVMKEPKEMKTGSQGDTCIPMFTQHYSQQPRYENKFIACQPTNGYTHTSTYMGFHDSSAGKESACNAGDLS